MTQTAATQIAQGRRSASRAVLWTALALTGLLALLATAVAIWLMPWIVQALEVSPELRIETIFALRVFSLSIVPAILTSVLIGFLTAYSEFGLINAIKIPTGTPRRRPPAWRGLPPE